MQLRLAQLEQHLNKSLSPIYLLSGDEPLQLLEAQDKIRQTARQQGIQERELLEADKNFDWSQLRGASNTLSLFSSNKLLELRIQGSGPGKLGSQAICDYITELPEGDVLIISMTKIDKRTLQSKWCKQIDKVGAIIQIWPLDIKQLPAWIKQRFQTQNRDIDTLAAELLAERVEGNMLAARQEIDKLCLLIEASNISLKMVMHAVSDSSRYGVFDLVEAAFSGDIERSYRMLQGLRGEGSEVIALYAALMWEFRRVNSMAHDIAAGKSINQVMSEYRVWQQRQTAIKQVLKRHGKQGLDNLLAMADELDQVIKGYKREDVWNEFTALLLAIAGVKFI